jgi:predicted DNA-binding WGR domain protein
MKDRYEFNDGKSKKFWEVQVKDKMLIVRYGRIGTEGQVHVREYFSPDEALNARIKLILEKTRKGYVLMSSANAIPDQLKLSIPNDAICHMYVGEHIERVAQGLCKWLTKCLKEKISPAMFAKNWNSYLEWNLTDGEWQDNEQRRKLVPGFTIIEGEKQYWEDNLDLSEGELDGIYKEAFEKGAERFITFYNNAYIDIVAIKGTPTGREIALLVLGTKENVGEWTDNDTREALGDKYLLEELEARN